MKKESVFYCNSQPLVLSISHLLLFPSKHPIPLSNLQLVISFNSLSRQTRGFNLVTSPSTFSLQHPISLRLLSLSIHGCKPSSLSYGTSLLTRQTRWFGLVVNKGQCGSKGWSAQFNILQAALTTKYSRQDTVVRIVDVCANRSLYHGYIDIPSHHPSTPSRPPFSISFYILDKSLKNTIQYII